MNKLWTPQYIENKYIDLAEPLVDFENILLEDIGLLKNQKTAGSMKNQTFPLPDEILVSSNINSVTQSDDEVKPFFLNIA